MKGQFVRQVGYKKSLLKKHLRFLSNRPYPFKKKLTEINFVPHCLKGRYCDVAMIRPQLYHGIGAGLSRSPSPAIMGCNSISYLCTFLVYKFVWFVSLKRERLLLLNYREERKVSVYVYNVAKTM